MIFTVNGFEIIHISRFQCLWCRRIKNQKLEYQTILLQSSKDRYLPVGFDRYCLAK